MLTEEEIAKYMETPEGALELQRILESIKNDGQIGASPDNLDATRGLPLETIGASPVNPGATRGLPPGISGINPEEENKRRMLQQLLQNQGMRYR
jgi:hypothetical protein